MLPAMLTLPGRQLGRIALAELVEWLQLRGHADLHVADASDRSQAVLIDDGLGLLAFDTGVDGEHERAVGTAVDIGVRHDCVPSMPGS